jgi:PAS domain S-box-containing protein
VKATSTSVPVLHSRSATFSKHRALTGLKTCRGGSLSAQRALLRQLRESEMSQQSLRQRAGMPKRSPSPASSAADGRLRARVLLVADDAERRDRVRRILDTQFEVTLAANSEETTKSLHLSRPDLVLADANMSRKNGFAPLKAIRANRAAETLPVILWSARTGDERAIHGLHRGVDTFLIEPFTEGELIARATAQIAVARLEREAAERKAQEQRADALESLNRALQREIAERKQSEEAMQLQLEVLNNIPAVAWTVTPDGTLDFINRFYLEATGLSAEFCLSRAETWKKRPEDLPPFLSGLHPDHRRRVAEMFWGGIRSGTDWAFEAPFLHADNAYHWHFTRAVPLRDRQGKIVRFVGTCADIEELRMSQEALQLSEKRLQAIVNNSPSQIFLKDIEGRYLLVNEVFKRVYQIGEEEIIGKMDEEVFGPERAMASRVTDRQVIDAGSTVEFEDVTQGRDGTRWGIVQKFPLFDAAGTVFAIGGIVTDITARKIAEEALRNAQAELARASRFTTVGQLAASIAHELNQPLSAIHINGNTCLHWLDVYPPHIDKAHAAAERIIGNGTRAIEVIDRIRAMLQKSVPERVKLDINVILEETLALVKAELRARDVVVVTELAESPLAAMGDRVQLQQVVLNLIMNGAEAMSFVRDRPRLLQIKSCCEGSDGVLVAVEDSGTGFDPAILKRVFEPFFTTKTGGMGMGLSICRSIVEAHGGRLWASPGPIHGALVQFTLPADDDMS